MSMNVPDILDEVADEISQPNGWCQHKLGVHYEATGPVCATGGIYRILRQRGFPLIDQIEIFGPVEDLLRSNLEHYGLNPTPDAMLPYNLNWQLVQYNNAPWRTAGEIADLFRTAAKHLREMG